MRKGDVFYKLRDDWYKKECTKNVVARETGWGREGLKFGISRYELL